MSVSPPFLALALISGLAAGVAGAADNRSEVELGRMLFFDVNLSKNRTQSCAGCHDPAHGFVDARDNGVGAAVSLGDDGRSLGTRNAPTVSYAQFSPPFHRKPDGSYIGGQFLDGRERDLEGQASGPPLNPLEMAMPDQAAVVARLRENPDYVDRFTGLYGDGVMANDTAAYHAMTRAIASFERSDTFAPFDSKYDRYLRGEYKMTKQEELGRTLFFSQQFTNCNLCHQLKAMPGQDGETFSNYEFHNIGVPANPLVNTVDRGLLDNPAVGDPGQAGKFKVPTLRNVAVTGPYMHNGIFKDLRTVVLFYNKYNSRAAKRQINPETGKPWGPPEVADNVALDKLREGPALDDRRIDALVAFLKTLTDHRYEHLLTP